LFFSPLRFHVLPHSPSDEEHGINTTEVCSRQLKEDVRAQIPQTFTACCNTDEAPETDLVKADGEDLIIIDLYLSVWKSSNIEQNLKETLFVVVLIP